MSLFKVLIAGQIIEIETIYDYTHAICRGFLTEGNPAIKIHINQESIDYEKRKSKEQNKTDLQDQYYEATAVLRQIAERIIDQRIFLMHGAAIAVDRKAFLFTGKSGTGKSTHIYKWRKNVSNAFIVNGDKPFIMTGDIPMVYGSPWTGKEGIYTNTAVPLAAIIVMERAEYNEIHRISFAEAFPFLFQQVYRPEDEKKLRNTIRLLQSLENKIGFYKFRFNNMLNDCFEVSYQTLVGDSK